jgi:serine phosphatase RsbU (regulator of sigma subunit)
MRDFTDEELQQIIKKLDVRTFEAGTEILAEGQSTEGFHFLYQGTAEVLKQSATGKTKFLIDTLHPGALFGEMSAMTGQPTSASVQAKTVCTVLNLKKPAQLQRDIHVKLLLGSAHSIIHRLQTSTAKQAKAMAVEAELKVAWNIQKGFLPSAFPDLARFEIYGTCEPAKEIGGDYFDVFQIDERHYGLAIGDVSGKGVPAAIFMSGCRTLFRTLCADGAYPNEVLRQFNKRLVGFDSGGAMFITMFYGILDIETGKFMYASAGHNMPFLRLQRDGEVTVRELDLNISLVAGIMGEVDYVAETVTLHPGDRLVMFTDGVTEAVNEKQEQFGEERLSALIASDQSESVSKLVTNILENCKEFQGSEPQFDDMTMLVLRMK